MEILKECKCKLSNECHKCWFSKQNIVVKLLCTSNIDILNVITRYSMLYVVEKRYLMYLAILYLDILAYKFFVLNFLT